MVEARYEKLCSERGFHEENYCKDYWEKVWQSENEYELQQYLKGYNGITNPVVDIFKQNNVVSICDVACGFGAYSLMFASNGFEVEGFDISETAVGITKKSLEKYGIDSSKYKVADILNTGYSDEAFDGVVVHAVIDHLLVSDAKKAIEELCRITKKNGLIMLSFDPLEEEDVDCPHIVLEDGSVQYTTDDSRNMMIFHYYSNDEIKELLEGKHIEYFETRKNGERIVVVRK